MNSRPLAVSDAQCANRLRPLAIKPCLTSVSVSAQAYTVDVIASAKCANWASVSFIRRQDKRPFRVANTGNNDRPSSMAVDGTACR